MKKKTRQIALIGLCLLGVGVFIYDKSQGDPSMVSQAQAQAQARPQAATVSLNPVDAAAPATDAADSDENGLSMPCANAVKDRLNKIAGSNREAVDARDAFCVAPSWLPPRPAPALPTKTVAVAVNDGPDAHKKAEQFVQIHKFQAVIMGDSGAKILVNDKILAVGEEIDGFKLEKIENHRASFISTGSDASSVELQQKLGLEGQ